MDDLQTPDSSWANVRERLREKGMRWTPQRRLLISVLAEADGHVTGAQLIERCRRIDAATHPSTVYRTLDVLEELGYLRHAHGAGGQEEYHVMPATEHGHLHCESCGRSWELEAPEIAVLAESLRAGRQFTVDLSHVTISGTCDECRGRLLSK